MKNLTNFCKTVETGLKKVIYWYIVYVALLQVVLITLQLYLLLWYCWNGKIVCESG